MRNPETAAENLLREGLIFPVEGGHLFFIVISDKILERETTK